MSEEVKHAEDDEEQEFVEKPLSAEEQKLMKQLVAGKEVEDKLVQEDMHISLADSKYEWYLANKYDIDPKLGLIWKDYDQISKQKKVVFYLLKQIGFNLLRGKSIMSVSLPVTIMEPLTMLQRLSNVYSYLPAFSDRMQSPDPLEKFKAYIGFSIAALHISLQQRKPLNPVWGETFQGYLGDPHFTICCEQTSHHPPFAQILVDTPWYTIYARHQVEARTYPNTLRVTAVGKLRVVFKDEKHTTYLVTESPQAHISGLVVGQRVVLYEGSMEIMDVTNGIYMQARFNTEKQGFFERIFSKTKATRSDYFKGFITKNKELLKDTSRKAFYSKDIVTYFEGQWLENLVMDGEYYWQLGRENASKVISAPDHLESDSVNRKDLQVLARGDEAEAQKCKDEIEEVQRRDRKLREPFQKLRKSK